MYSARGELNLALAGFCTAIDTLTHSQRGSTVREGGRGAGREGGRENEDEGEEVGVGRKRIGGREKKGGMEEG